MKLERYERGETWRPWPLGTAGRPTHNLGVGARTVAILPRNNILAKLLSLSYLLRKGTMDLTRVDLLADRVDLAEAILGEGLHLGHAGLVAAVASEII